MFFLYERYYQNKYNKLIQRAKQLLNTISSLSENVDIMNILYIDINFSLLTEDYIEYFNKVGFPFDTLNYDEHYIRCAVKELADIQSALTNLYQKNVRKTEHEDFDALLSMIRESCYEGKYSVSKNHNSNSNLVKKVFLCKLMSFAYDSFTNDKEISFRNYIRLVDLYEFYKEGNQYQFGEYIEPLMNELSNYVSYSFSTSSNSDKPYVKK